MAAYYNEFDPQAAQWLRNLIAAGLIAPGDVDTRSIVDVDSDDLRGYNQCHFFAGIGAWSYALRRAGWRDTDQVWTGSCPCQPFSQAGGQAAFDDPRHLWPHFARLIGERRPPVVFGEQVASKAVDPWVDLVHTNLENLGYAFGCVPFPSAGVGAPHIRDRLFWVADTDRFGQPGLAGIQSRREPETRADCDSKTRWLGHPSGERLQERVGHTRIPGEQTGECTREAFERAGVHLGGLADTHGYRSVEMSGGRLHYEEHNPEPRSGLGKAPRAGAPLKGFWQNADWLFCRDGKWRPVEPGTFPLAHGAASRVVRLRAYGNAINAEAATQFIGAYLDARKGPARLELDELV